MVIAIGYNPSNGNLDLHNTETKLVQEFVVEKLNPNDIENIQNFFYNIRIHIKDNIDCFCLTLDSNYNSDFRKKFVEIANIFGVDKVRIIGFQHLLLIGAVRYLSNIPKCDDILWIIYCQKDFLFFTIWNFNRVKGWEFGSTQLLKSTEDLKKFENQQRHQNPSIFIYNLNKEINVDAISKIFSESKEVNFLQNVDNSYWSLQYARHYLKETGFEKYKTEVIFERRVNVCIDDDLLFQAMPFLCLPYRTSLTIKVKENAELKVVENNENTITKTFDKDEELKLIFNIDVNGVYNGHLENFNENEILTTGQNFPKKYSIPLKLKDFNPEFDAIGIGLGTTECCAAVIRKHGPDFVALDPTTSNRTLPSYVGFDEKEPKCGKIVLDRMRNHANCTVYDTKRIMGREFDKIVIDSLWPFNVINANSGASIEVDTFEGKKIKSPEEIVAVLLAHIKSNLESYQGRILSEAVITIPSGSTDEQIIATAKAAELAGWETVHFLPEPIAAAFAYFTEKDFLNNCNILICDCGGGTVDICVAKISGGKFELLNYDGDSYLGGRDFDKLLFNYFETILKHTYKIDISKSNKKYLLNQMCQNIKHNLSTLAEDTLAVDSFECDSNDFIPITREKFEILALPLILKMKDVILRSISKANLQKDQINYVFQVGGGCRMPMIKKMLKEIFPNSNHQCSIYPDWVVAHGAALYAYHLKTTKANGNKSPLSNRAVTGLLDRLKGVKNMVKFQFLPPKSSTNTTNIPA